MLNEWPVSVVDVRIDHLAMMADLFACSEGMNGCWCMWPLRPPRTHEPDTARNKAEMSALLAANESVGLLAVAQGRALGWCACGPRGRSPQYEARDEATTCWAIPCLYVRPGAARDSVACALIEAVRQQAIGRGAKTVEGPPPWWSPGDSDAVALAIDTLLSNGFVRTGPGARMPELRLQLSSA